MSREEDALPPPARHGGPADSAPLPSRSAQNTQWLHCAHLGLFGTSDPVLVLISLHQNLHKREFSGIMEAGSALRGGVSLVHGDPSRATSLLYWGPSLLVYHVPSPLAIILRAGTGADFRPTVGLHPTRCLPECPATASPQPPDRDPASRYRSVRTHNRCPSVTNSTVPAWSVRSTVTSPRAASRSRTASWGWPKRLPAPTEMTA
jgi:hypothetical protein